MVGVSRAKRNEDLEGLLKYKFFDQTTDNAIPVSVSAFANMTYSVKESADFKNDTYRFVYCSQVILARKFSSRLSVVVIPTFTHRNFVGADDENNTWSLSGGFRFKFTPSASVIFDYSKTLGRENLVLPRYRCNRCRSRDRNRRTCLYTDVQQCSGILENDYLVNTFDVMG
jgi:hypothetical protein